MLVSVINPTRASMLNNNYQKGIWFIWYYAEWCGHCKIMEQEWKTFVSKVPRGINVARVESTAIPQLNYQPQVMGYPTLRLYHNGNEVSEYEGERTASAFRHFLLNFVRKLKQSKTSLNTHRSHRSPRSPRQSHSSHSSHSLFNKPKNPTLIRLPTHHKLNPNLANQLHANFGSHQPSLPPSQPPLDINKPPMIVNNQKIASIINAMNKPSNKPMVQNNPPGMVPYKPEEPMPIYNQEPKEELKEVSFNLADIKPKKKSKKSKSKPNKKSKSKSKSKSIPKRKSKKSKSKSIPKKKSKNSPIVINNNGISLEVTVKGKSGKKVTRKIPLKDMVNGTKSVPKNVVQNNKVADNKMNNVVVKNSKKVSKKPVPRNSLRVKYNDGVKRSFSFFNNKPANNKPVNNKPEDNKPEDNKPEDNKPADNKPEDNKQVNNRPADNKPEDNKPEVNNRPEVEFKKKRRNKRRPKRRV